MSSPTNIANRITAGLESINPPLTLIRIAAEATTQGINEASAIAATQAMLYRWVQLQQMSKSTNGDKRK
jgi:uncharacterized membrane protein